MILGSVCIGQKKIKVLFKIIFIIAAFFYVTYPMGLLGHMDVLWQVMMRRVPDNVQL
jgi:hypothetical protein